PINYMEEVPHDAIARLQHAIDQGEVSLDFDRDLGYLRSVLAALNVPESSQALVFSKTSFQLRRISPRTPRAIYFGDDVYVGWVHGGDVMEFSAVDPNLGANFYTLSQQDSSKPRFVRHTHECLQCHGSSLTKNVPGHVVRSVYTRPDGQPLLGAGTYISDHTSPLAERWGGWYVTGSHGAQRHLGNLLLNQVDDPAEVDLDRGANVTELASYFNTAGYLSGESDIVALLVLEHQAMMHNLITQANFLTRVALQEADVMNEMLERPDGYLAESTMRRIHNAAEPVVEYMLFCGEAPLTDPIVGTSSFAKDFAARGPHDSQGRSLRDLDLKSRLCKHPCSYLIYSKAFSELPEIVRERIYLRLWEVLSGQDTSEPFDHLTTTDRGAIVEILRSTKSDLPDFWRSPN
ncbi:MAG: hypothetical protein KDA42_03485, partial [Planctomycetales bacterium]|nr:hypothetical protein [Planctomycetales bacterium]